MTRIVLASRGYRLLGQAIDGIIGAIPWIVLGIIGRFTDMLHPVLAVIAGAWAAYYYLFADGFEGGQSLAKRWLGMRVIDMTTGAPCTFGDSFIRNLLLAILGPIDWVFIFGERHQRLGDKAAGTIVVMNDD